MSTETLSDINALARAGFDHTIAAERVRRACAAGGRTVILGAGSNTRGLLYELGDDAAALIHRVLDDDPNACGDRLQGVPVQSPNECETRGVDRVIITSETYESELTRRARETFPDNVPILYSFDRRSSLASRLNDTLSLIEQGWPARPADALWHAADRLQTLLRERLEQTPTWRYGPRRQVREFADLRRALDPYVRWQDARLFNFGCGRFQPLGISLLALLLGARQSLATDLLGPLDARRSATALAELAARAVLDPAAALGPGAPPKRELVDRLDALLDVTALHAGDFENGIRSSKLAYRAESIYEAKLPRDAFDIIVSRSVFEHLPDVPGALDALFGTCRGGGIVFLMIDFSDHRRYQNPGRYRHYSHLIDLDEPTYQSTNRLRYPDYPPLFERAGFSIESYTPDAREPLPGDQKARLARRYRAMSDEELSFTAATAILRRV